MGPLPADEVRTTVPASGEHERHLAISGLALQASQVVGVLSMLVAVTVLARHLSLSEFGTYGLLVSFAAYVLFIQASIETAAVKAIAEAADQPARDRAFSTALVLYTAAGVVAGGLIAGLGTVVLRLFDIPAALHHEAQVSTLAVAGTVCLGWPLKVFQDVLRASNRFVASALGESAGYVVLGASMAGLALGRAPLWALVATGASAPLAIGLASAVIVWQKRLPFRYRRDGLTAGSVREFTGLSAYLLAVGASGLVIYSLDRAVLAAFRPVATVGLYEGPVRAHNLIRQVQGALGIPALPTSARYMAEGDTERVRDLLLRGARYTLAVVVPLTVVFMVLARPILGVWLGPRFAGAGTAMTVLVAYWLVNANTGVASGMLVAAGRIRRLTVYSVAVALLNLGLSIALTPSLGLNGVVLGTTLSYLLMFPFFLALVLSTFPVSLSDFAREAWVPAYLTGAVVALALVAVRLWLPLESVPAVAAAGLLAVLTYWALYYAVWMRPSERMLVRSVVLAARYR